MLAITLVAQQQTGQDDPLPKGPGKEAVALVCGSCHDVESSIAKRRTSAEWKQTIDAMINRGALGSDEDFKAVTTYLSTYFGLVNVNTATAKEIEDVLEITPSVAEAVVRYRTERGPFETLAGLKSVPGIDAVTIEERKLRVTFK